MSFVETDRDPAPEGAVEHWLEAGDGLRVRTARWVPATAARGTVLVANGRTEFIEKYFELTGDLLRRGFAVATLDWRGQGLSDRLLADPLKGHVGRFEDYVGDLDRLVREVLEPHCPAPFRVIAHSMGGNITLRHLAQHPGVFVSAVFSAPMWGLGRARSVRPAERALAVASNAIGLGHVGLPGGGDDGVFEGNVLTSDRDRFARFTAQTTVEPRLRLGPPTFGWAREAIRSIDHIHAPGFCEAIDTEVHVCTAGADALVSLEAQRILVERLPHASQTVVPDSRHEIIMEADGYRDRFLAVLDEAWGG